MPVIRACHPHGHWGNNDDIQEQLFADIEDSQSKGTHSSLRIYVMEEGSHICKWSVFSELRITKL